MATFWFIVLAAGVVLFFLLNVGMGSASITVRDIFRVLFGEADPHENAYLIIRRIRLPRTLAGLIGGASLAIAGFLLQTFFANPIVEPYILGISSGSSLFVALVMLGGFTFGVQTITPMFLFAGAFIGAMVIMLIVLLAATKVKSIVTLLIVGLMAGYVCGAVTSILTSYAEKEQIANYSLWSMGTFSGFTWKKVGVMGVLVGAMLILSLLMAKPLNALNMGDKYAQSMGINVKLTRYAIVLISSVLTAAVTAFAGPISFIGLAIPHICRILFHTSDSRILLPAGMLGGALMASACDFVARNIISPSELPLGSITAIIGAPIVVFLLTRKENL